MKKPLEYGLFSFLFIEMSSLYTMPYIQRFTGRLNRYIKKHTETQTNISQT